MSPDLITSISAFVFTVMILSYLIGDSPLFRVAVYIFIGVAAGYVAAVAWWQVLWPDLLQPLAAGSTTARAMQAVPLLLGGLLLMKAWPPLSRLGAPAMGLLVGAASAVAIGGAIIGTLLPQVSATITAFDGIPTLSLDVIINATLVLAGVITTLIYFHFGARTTSDGSVRRLGLLEMAGSAGGVFLAVTLGVLFAGVYAAALTALIERLHFVWTFLGWG